MQSNISRRAAAKERSWMGAALLGLLLLLCGGGCGKSEKEAASPPHSAGAPVTFAPTVPTKSQAGDAFVK